MSVALPISQSRSFLNRNLNRNLKEVRRREQGDRTTRLTLAGSGTRLTQRTGYAAGFLRGQSNAQIVINPNATNTLCKPNENQVVRRGRIASRIAATPMQTLAQDFPRKRNQPVSEMPVKKRQPSKSAKHSSASRATIGRRIPWC